MNQPFRYEFDRKNLRHWCFDDCPKEELVTCWHYECLRDCSSVIERVLQWRKNKPKGGETLLPELDSAESLLELYSDRLYERFITEWPEVPYLDIERGIRVHHLAVQYLLGKRLLDLRPKNKPVAVFPIRNWSTSNPQIVRDFQQWLKSARPKCTIRETRGKPTPVRLLRPRLRALGAWRLSRVMPQSEVIKYAFGLGHPLYKNQPQISKVVTKMSRYLARLNQNAG